MMIYDNRGTTFVEVLASTIIIFYIIQMVFGLLVYQKKFSDENYLSGEHMGQLNFAETYLKRDFFESRSSRVNGVNQLELTDYSGKVISYYLANDPYGEESWKKKSSRTLYRKVTGENAQPITQYCDSFFAEEYYGGSYLKVSAELIAGKSKLKVEEFYEYN